MEDDKYEEKEDLDEKEEVSSSDFVHAFLQCYNYIAICMHEFIMN